MDHSPLAGLLGCGVGLVVFLFFSLIFLAVGLLICWLLYDAVRRVPEPYRQIAPPLVFLLLVPLLNLVWLFYVVIKVSQSFQKYFASQQRTDVGDCGYNIGLGWAIASVCSLLPLLHLLAALVALVLMVLYLVKVTQLKGMIGPGGATLVPPPVPPMPPPPSA